jgi:hypothetical protein
MSELTRRRDPDARQETRLIHYGDVRVGTIAERVGNPSDTPHWQWSCGFYPGSHPRQCAGGTAANFETARSAFEAAWRVFVANRTEADFEEYRRHRARDVWKRTMWDAGLKLPTQAADGRASCFCGAAIGLADTERHVYAAHMETA